MFNNKQFVDLPVDIPVTQAQFLHILNKEIGLDRLMGMAR